MSRLSLKLATTRTEPHGSPLFPFQKTRRSTRMSLFIGDIAVVATSFALPQPWDITQATLCASKLCETTLSVVPQCRVARREVRLPKRALPLIVPLRFSDVQCLGPPSRAHTGLVAHLSLLVLLVWVNEASAFRICAIVGLLQRRLAAGRPRLDLVPITRLIGLTRLLGRTGQQSRRARLDQRLSLGPA
jgi:hypothetical protein